MIRPLGAIGALLLLAACTPPLPVAPLVPEAEVVKSIEPNRALQRGIVLGAMSVPEDMRLVTPVTLRETLERTLREAHLLGHNETIAKDASAYKLDASLTNLDVSMASLGFASDAATSIDYTLTRLADERILYHDTIQMSAHAGWMDAPDGAIRQRLVMSTALRENFTHLLRVLGELEIPPVARPAKILR